MEFQIKRGILANELGLLAGVVEKKSPIPLLENSIIKSEGMKLKLTATDLDLTIFSECTVETISGEGAFCVPTRRLFDIVKAMPEGLIKIKGDSSQWVIVQAKGSNFKLPGANPDSFPEFQKIPGDQEWTNVPSKALRSVLKGVGFAASTSDDGRFALGGVKIEIRETEIRMVATDGHRLSLASGPLNDLMFSTIDILVPAKGVGELSKLLTDYEGPVGMAIAGNGLFFKLGNRILYTRMLTGKFPAYQPFLDVIYQATAVFQADVLAQSLKRTMLVDDEGDGISLSFKDGKANFYSQNANAGECYEIMDSNFNGGEFKISCNPRFLLDFLEQMGTDKVEFQVKDNKTQIHLRCLKDSISYRYFLVPMRSKAAP